ALSRRAGPLTRRRRSGRIFSMLRLPFPPCAPTRRWRAFVLRSLLGLALLEACARDVTAPGSATSRLTYPATRQSAVVDDYHGVRVADPYRWLEDDNSPETKAWVDAQNAVTFRYLRQIPELPAIRARLTKLWSYERYGVPFRQGGRYFFTK